MTVYDIRIKEDAIELEKAIEAGLKECFFGVMTHRLKDGRQIKVELKTLTFNFKGKKAMLAMGNDVTETLKLDEDKIKGRADLLALIDNTDDAIWAVDVNGNITVANENYRQMYRSVYNSDITIGMSLFEVLPDKIKEERLEMFHRAMQGDKIRFGIRSKINNEDRTLEASMNPIRLEDGSITGVAYFCRDVTLSNQNLEKIKNTEARYSSLIETMNDGFIHADENDIVRFANERFYELVGYSEEEIIGKDNHSLLLEGESLQFANQKNELRAKGISDQYELKIRRKDGNYIYVIVHSRPVFDNDGKFGGVVATFTDITERKQSEDRVNEINKELDQFAYVVSHDLKAPLRAINSLSTWIEEDLHDKMDEETRSSMTLLRGRVGRMEALINGVLDYSRVGRQKATVENVHLGELLDEVVDLLSPDPGFKINLPNNLPSLKTEKIKLQQVFSNLISNSLKYHDKDSGNIDISIKDMGELYEFSVKDDGPGIDPQYHDKIFVIFQTLKSKDEVESTGVGLSIVKKIINDAGGSIRVESNPGEGAAFIFSWPKTRADKNESLLIAA